MQGHWQWGGGAGGLGVGLCVVKLCSVELGSQLAESITLLDKAEC